MSLVDGLRRDASTKRDHELRTISSRHRSQLRDLWSVHHLIHHNLRLDSLVKPPRDAEIFSDDEAVFLKKNDLSNGLLFDPASLSPISSTPAPQPVDASIYASKPSNASIELKQQVEQSENDDATAEDGVAAAVAAQLDSTEALSAVASQKTTSNAALDEGEATQSVLATQNATTQPDGPDVAPVDAAPPLPEEEADLTASEQHYVDQQEPSRPAKVVHLPPEDVQEAKLRQREADGERRRQSDAESKSSQHLTAPQTEIASSPSSTVGPYSAATPVPPQDSPDTSPDSESAQVEVLPPKDLRPSPEEQRQKEEHDRLLEAQKEIAKRDALGDIDQTPDEQLQWEAREAAAREAEEQAARDVGGPEPDTKDARDSTDAEQAVEDMEVDDESQAQASHEPVQEEKHVKTPPLEHVEESSKEAEPKSDGSNDDVASRRNRTPKPIDTAVRSEAPMEPSTATVRPERMTTRVSSGVLRQKSVSEILGQSQSPPVDDRFDSSKAAMSPEPISPMTQRHPNDSSNITLATPVSIARQTPRSLQQHRLSTVSRPSLDQLDTLKGAADDPNKDYLEPLFRIQAHEAPNSNTKTLPELVRTGTKALSTDDHFTAVHERLDFRMLRRIYQLQNANKWSLRQMEKCREPEQPVTLHDHMMEEMKWMRKDFRAERKLKKNLCAFLAQKCAEWVASNSEERKLLQVKVKAIRIKSTEDSANTVPELEQAGDSAAEDDLAPTTPRDASPATVVIAPEFADTVQDLRKSGKLGKALITLPIVGLYQEQDPHPTTTPVTQVSKFIDGKVLPKTTASILKRSRFQYEDEEEILHAEPSSKRLREEQLLEPENVDCALFQDESKPIRERLHSNNAFRPPSEFIMPSTPFYEFRNGSQWIQEDDQKLRKLAKEYSFNWSLIADEMALPTRFKSSAERRTPWECFERWVELESLPADMRKTLYFKTWFQRLQQSQEAADRRYQQQVAHLQQAAAASGAPAHVPPRRRTAPSRVEKRKSSRYLWMIDGFRKLAKKREQQQWKQAETARAAAQRKAQTETQPVKMVKMTPQEFSKKRHERDMQMQEAQRQYRAKQLEAQQRQIAMARQQAQQGAMPNGAQGQQRLPGTNQQGQQGAMQQPQANGGQQVPNANGQNTAQPGQVRQAVPVAPQRNGHLAPPQVNGQGMQQAPMQARPGMPQPNMPQMGQVNGQGRNAQFPNQQYPMLNGNMPSPGGNMTTAQQLQQNQALLAAFHQQQQNGNQGQNMNQNGSNQAMSASPSMPPPPTPHGGTPQQLSSGHVPQIIAITNQLRVTNPGLSDDQLKAMATQQMKAASQSSSQTRQSAMNAAAGIPNQSPMQQQYSHNQNAYQRNGQMPSGMNGMYANGDGNTQPASLSPASSSSPSQQQIYAQKLWQRQQHQMNQMQQMQSPNAQHAQLNGSPGVSHASPSMTPASPSMQYSNMNHMGGMGTPVAANNMNNGRPSSRSNTPGMQRLGSSGSGITTMGNGMQSPGSTMQGSPRNMQASMAR